MKVRELKDYLEELGKGHDDADVILGTQSNYPLQANIQAVWRDETGDKPVLVIVEGSQLHPDPYGKRIWWDDHGETDGVILPDRDEWLGEVADYASDCEGTDGLDLKDMAAGMLYTGALSLSMSAEQAGQLVAQAAGECERH